MALLSEIESGLRKGHFHVHYQPVVDACTKELTGFETLIRWQKDDRVLMNASEFIEDISHHYTLIKKMTICIIHDVIMDFCSLTSPHLPGKSLSINMSITLLMDNDIAKQILRLDDFFRQKRLRLIIEITEYENILDFPEAESQFCMYAENGISFAIDDFTGRCEDFDLIRISKSKMTKLDKSILREAVNYHGLLKMKNLIWILRELGQVVVAEGIENEYEETLLASTGIDLLQGYRYGHALSYQRVVKLYFEQYT